MEKEPPLTNEWLDIVLNPNENYVINSENLSVIPGKKYSISSAYVGLEGKPFCGIFGVISIKNNAILETKIYWLNDFSNNRKDFNMIFRTVSDTIILTYQVNHPFTPISSKCHFKILPFDKVVVKEIDDGYQETCDKSNVFQINENPMLSIEQELTLEKNLWIFAPFRSGTTWLATQLLSYKTHVLNEPYIGRHLVDFAPSRPEPDLIFEKMQARPDYFFHHGFEQSWNFFLRKMILNRIFSQFNDISNNIIIKEPNGSLASGVISKCLLLSKKIFVFRDARDVIDSRLDAMSEDGWMSKHEGWNVSNENRLWFIEREAKRWIKNMDIILRTMEKIPNELKFVVRYELLRENTVKELRQIYEFLNIDIPDANLQKLVEKSKFESIPSQFKGPRKGIRLAKPGGWKDSFSSTEKDLLDKILGDTLQKIGY